MKRLLWLWLPPVAWMGLIFVLSAQPDLPSLGPPGTWSDTLFRKAGHVAAYGVLAWLYQRALCQRFPDSAASRAVSVGLAMVYGVTDELHQTFVPGRRGRLVDVVVDGIGAGSAILLGRWVKRWWMRER